MPLDPASLQQELLRHFRKPPKTAPKTASRLADIYYAYASGAVAGPSSPVLNDGLKGVMTLALKGALLAAMSNPRAGNPATFASAWSTGITAFWTAPPVAFQAPPFPLTPVEAGISIPSPSMPATLQTCIASLVGVWNDASVAATQMSTCLDSATRQVIVTLFPSAVPWPLS